MALSNRLPLWGPAALASFFVLTLGFLLGMTVPCGPFSTWLDGHFRDGLGVIALVVSLGTFVYQMGRSRFAHKTDLMFRLSEEFRSEDMIAARSKAALHLQSNVTGRDHNVDKVLNFFEDVAFLLRRDAIDLESVWHYFSYWSEGYWEASTCYRVDQRRRDRQQDDVWTEQEELHKRIRKYGTVLPMSSDEVQSFMKEETDMIEPSASND